MVMLLFLSLIFIIIFLINNQRNSRFPPGPKGLPFIGNTHQVHIINPHLWLTQLSYKYGPLISLRIFQTPVIVISSEDVAKKSLKHNDIAFSGRPHTSAAFRFSYGQNDIICASYSEYWREMRKMVVLHLFTPQKVRLFRSVREDEVSRLMDEISHKANSGQIINIGEMLLSSVCSLLSRVAFGKRFDQERRFDKIMSQFVAFDFKTFLEDYSPLFGWINRISGQANKLDSLFKDMDSFYQELIDEHLSPNRPDSMKNDILDLLTQLKDDPSAPVKIEWNHIKAILMNVFVAGTDTSAVTVIWALTALLKKPNAMKKVQQEMRSLVGNKRFVDEDDIVMLPYLKAVVKETMRLYPAVPLVPKETLEKCIIDSYEIQPKTFVLVNIWAINRDPEYWENPNEFFPERFLKSSIQFNGQDFGFLPFGAGRRVCPGVHHGAATVELALANLLYSFDWEMPHGMTEKDIDTDASTGLVMHKKNPLCLIAKSYI